MGKKYIIELEEGNFHKTGEAGLESLYRVKGFKSLVFDKNGIRKLTPYKELNKGALDAAYAHGHSDAKAELRKAKEKIVADAYKRGLNDGQREAGMDYEKGLNDAWEAARKLVLYPSWGGLPVPDIKEIFGPAAKCSMILRDLSPKECIEKIEQYEKKQKKEIKIGDEIEYAPDKKAIVIGYKEPGNILCVITGSDYTDLSMWRGNVRKTGRAFPEIVEVLQKLGGE